MSASRREFSHLREPKIAGLGVVYAPELTNIILSEITPGHELETIEAVDEELRNYSRALATANLAREHRKPTSNTTSHIEEIDPRVEKLPPFLVHPAHAALLGRYSIATIFTSYGFGLCQVFGTLPHVKSAQFIIGAIPKPHAALGCRLERLKTDIRSFLTPYDHRIESESYIPQDVRDLPVVAICQLQVLSLLSTVSAGSLVLPTMLALDRVINQTCEDLNRARDPSREPEPVDISALLVDNYRWSDFTLLLRCRDVSHFYQCLDGIRSLRIRDIYRERGNLIERHQSEKERAQDVPELKELQDEQLAINRRFQRVVNVLRAAADGGPPSAEKAGNYFFSTSLSAVGALWPYPHLALQREYRERLPHGQVKKKRKTGEPDHWKFRGKVSGELRMAIKPGHEKEVWRILRESCARVAPRSFHTFGFSDIVIPLEDLARSQEVRVGDGIETSEMIGRALHLRWRLLGEPMFPMPSVHNRCRFNVTELINFFVVQAHVKFDAGTAHADHEMEDEQLPLTYYGLEAGYCKFISEYTRRNKVEHPLSDHDATVKRLKVNRYLRDALLQVMCLWRREIADMSESDYVLELAEFFETWKSVMDCCLGRSSCTRAEVESLIRSFAVPFGEAVIQKAMSGFHMSYSPDFVAEYKGGLSKLATGLDGLMKGILALVGKPGDLGALTLICQEPMARIEIKKMRREESGQEYTFAITRITATHLFHPIKLGGILHEMFHVILDSAGFRSTLLSSKRGEYLLDRIDAPKMNSPEGLSQQRVEEIIVEYMIAYLVFPDKPSLYSMSYLLQLSVHPAATSYDRRTNHMVLTEHITRCFFVEWTLKRVQWKDDKGKVRNFARSDVLEELVQEVSTWWAENYRYVVNDGRAAKHLEEALKETVKRWVDFWGVPDWLYEIGNAVEQYFGKGKCHNSKDKESRFLRKKFKEVLDSSRKHIGTVEGMLEQSPSCGSPVHFVFHEELSGDGQRTRTENDRPLRIRRLESLVGYFILIRAFYGVIHRWLNVNEKLALHVRRVGADVDFSSLGKETCDAFNDILMDPVRGTIFSVGPEAHRKYMGLRIAVTKSLWHLAEITKNSDLVNMSRGH